MAMKLLHQKDKILARRKKFLTEGSILWKTLLKKLSYKFRVPLNKGEGKY